MQSTIDPPDWVRMYERLILRTEDALAGYHAPYAKSNIAEIRFLQTELVSFYQRLAVWRLRCAEAMARRVHSPDGDAYWHSTERQELAAREPASDTGP